MNNTTHAQIASSSAQMYKDVITNATVSCLSSLGKACSLTPSEIAQAVIDNTNEVIAVENTRIPRLPLCDGLGNVIVDKSGNQKTVAVRPRWQSIKRLSSQQLVEIMLFFHHIALVDIADCKTDAHIAYATGYRSNLLAIYCTDGPNAGTYVTDKNVLFDAIRAYDDKLYARKFNEIRATLMLRAPIKARCDNSNLIAVNNGVFDYDAKTLLPFSPEYVFLTKSHVNYNAAAPRVVIHNTKDNTDWDVDSWLNGLSNDPKTVTLLWQMLGAVIRPQVRWNKSILLYSARGTSGRSSLCKLMRNLCGNYACITLGDFGRDRELQSLPCCNAIIVDENDPNKLNVCCKNSGTIKAVIVGMLMRSRRMSEDALAFRFRGFMVQCVDDVRYAKMPLVLQHDMILVPLSSCFIGIENHSIRDDYLSRDDVLEYVLKKLLHTNYHELSIPACHNV